MSAKKPLEKEVIAAFNHDSFAEKCRRGEIDDTPIRKAEEEAKKNAREMGLSASKQYFCPHNND